MAYGRFKNPYHRTRAMNKEDSLYRTEAYLLPKKTIEMLKKMAKSKNTTASRLVAIAIDNELDTTSPFRYDVPLTKDYKEDQYPDEMQRIFKFLKIGAMQPRLDTLVLARRDLGVESKEVILKCLSEMIDRGVLEIGVGFRGQEVVRTFIPTADIENEANEVDA